MAAHRKGRSIQNELIHPAWTRITIEGKMRTERKSMSKYATLLVTWYAASNLFRKGCWLRQINGSIFLAVVDPGVGSARRGLAARAGDYFFVAPDNGVLTSVFQELEPNVMVSLTERFYAHETVSRTFEGRDRFGPGAAWIAKGIEVSKLGSPFKNYHRLTIQVPEVCGECIKGAIVRVDHFGNLVTNISLRVFQELSGNGSVKFEVGNFLIPRLVETYGDIAAGEVCGLFGGTGHLEFAANANSAAELLGVSSGLSVIVSKIGA